MNCFAAGSEDEQRLEMLPMEDHLRVRVKQTEMTASEMEELHRRRFIDKEFLPTNANAGIQQSELVEWLPLSTLVKANGYQQPCYSVMTADLHSPDNGHHNPNIKDAVYFMSFVKSSCLQELMNKPYDSQGAYSFNMFQNGFVVRTLVDELVPCINGYPVYTPPYQQRMYPGLIEKTLAKISGGYPYIPRKVPQIMEMLTFFPRRRWSVPRQENQQAFVQEFFNSLTKHNVVLFRSKDTEKLSVYGLERNVYYLINSLTKTILDREVVLCQIIQPKTRKADWSGRYSNSDSIWRRFKQLPHTPKGTMMCSEDLFKVADEFVVLHNTSNMNINWVEAVQSYSNHATYFELEVVATSSEVVLYTSLAHGPCRSSIILAEITNGAYSYVKGNMEQWSLTNCLSVTLQPGRYLLFVKTEWQNAQKVGSFNLFYGFTEQLVVRRSSKQHHQDFLSLLFTEHALKQNSHYLQLIRRHPLVFVSLRLMYEETGYAYLKIYVAPDATNSLMVEFNSEQHCCQPRKFRQKGFLLKKPYNVLKGSQSIVLAPGDSTIILCKVVCNSPHEKMLFPPDSLRIYEL